MSLINNQLLKFKKKAGNKSTASRFLAFAGRQCTAVTNEQTHRITDDVAGAGDTRVGLQAAAEA